MMTKLEIVGWSIGLSLAAACILEFIFRRHHRNWRVNKKLDALMDQARHAEIEELDALSIDVADYASDLFWNTRKQKTKIATIIAFINGRNRQYQADRVRTALEQHAIAVAARAGAQSTGAQTSGQSSNPGEADPHGTNAGPGDHYP